MLDNPQGEVEYMLVDKSDADLILGRYPSALDGGVPFLDTVVSNERYELLRIVEGVPTDTGSATVPEQSGPIGSAPPITGALPQGGER